MEPEPEADDEATSPGTEMFERMLGQLAEDCADWAIKYDTQKARAEALERVIAETDAALQAAIDAEVDEVEEDTGLPIDAPPGVWLEVDLDKKNTCLHYAPWGMPEREQKALFDFFDTEPWCYMARTSCDGTCCEFCRSKQSLKIHYAKYNHVFEQQVESPATTLSFPWRSSSDDDMSPRYNLYKKRIEEDFGGSQ